MGYDYTNLSADISSLARRNYAGVKITSIGKSVSGRDIFAIFVGNGDKKVLFNGAHHGLEYLTAALVMRFANACADAFESRLSVCGENIHKLLQTVTAVFVPMVNPDGVDIAVNGWEDEYSRYFHGETANVKQTWQANVRGVDINHNYNAAWKSIAPVPGPTRYSGCCCESEPETQAMVGFTRQTEPALVVAYHSQGEEIFYDFEGKYYGNTLEIAQKVAVITGYRLAKPEALASFGGYKDWFISEFKKPGFTIEVGRGKNPLNMSLFKDIYDANLPAMVCFIKSVVDD